MDFASVTANAITINFDVTLNTAEYYCVDIGTGNKYIIVLDAHLLLDYIFYFIGVKTGLSSDVHFYMNILTTSANNWASDMEVFFAPTGDVFGGNGNGNYCTLSTDSLGR